MRQPSARQTDPGAAGHSQPQRERAGTAEATAAALEGLRQRLVEHSALEDLGPLFAPEANQPLRKPR